LSITVGVFPGFEPVDVNFLRYVVDSVENAKITDADPVTFFSGQFQTSEGPGIIGQEPDFLHDEFEDLALQII